MQGKRSYQSIYTKMKIQKIQQRLLPLHYIQVMSSTPKMHMKKTKGLFALVEGECDWVVFTGRNYKVSLFIKSGLQQRIKV